MVQAAVLVFFLCVFNKQTPDGNWGQNIGSYRGVSAYSNGSDSGSYSIAEPIGQDGPKYQCDEYCRRFYRLKYGLDTREWEYNTEDCFAMLVTWDSHASRTTEHASHSRTISSASTMNLLDTWRLSPP